MVVPPFYNPEYVENLDENIELFFHPDASFRLCENEGQYFTNTRSNDAVLYHARESHQLHLGTAPSNASRPSGMSISSSNVGVHASEGLFVRSGDDASDDPFVHLHASPQNAALRLHASSNHGAFLGFTASSNDTARLTLRDSGGEGASVRIQHGMDTHLDLHDQGIVLRPASDRAYIRNASSNQDTTFIVLESTQCNGSLLAFQKEQDPKSVSLHVPEEADRMVLSISNNTPTFRWGPDVNTSEIPLTSRVMRADDLLIYDTLTCSNAIISQNRLAACNAFFDAVTNVLSTCSNLDVIDTIDAPVINVNDKMMIASNATLEVKGEFINDGNTSFNKDVYFLDDISLRSNIRVDESVYVNQDVAVSNDLRVYQDALVYGNLALDRKATFCNDGITFRKDVVFEREFDVKRLAAFSENALMRKNLELRGNLNQEAGQHTHVANLTVAEDTVLESLSVRGTFDLQQQLVLNAPAVFQQGFRVENADIALEKGLRVQQDVGFCNNMHVKNDVHIDGHLDVGDIAAFSSGDIRFQRPTQFERDITVDGACTLNSNLTVRQNIRAEGDIVQSESNHADIGNLNVVHDTTLQNATVTGNLTVHNGLDMGSLTTFRDGIRVQNRTTDLDALLVRQEATFNERVTMEKPLDLLHDVFVHGETQLQDTLDVRGDVLVRSNLDVDEIARFHKDAVIENDARVLRDLLVHRDLNTHRLAVSNDALVYGKLETHGKICMSNTQSSSNPGYTWSNDEDTGFHHPAPDQLSLVTRGAERLRVDDKGFVGIDVDAPEYMLDVRGHVTGRQAFLAEDGSNTHPGYAFKRDQGTGMYLHDDGQLALSTDGHDRGILDAQGMQINGAVRVDHAFISNRTGEAASPAYTFQDDETTGLFLPEKDELAVTTGGQTRALFRASGLNVPGQINAEEAFLAENGRASRPVFTFRRDEHTGIYLHDDSNTLAFATGGEYRGAFTPYGANIDGDVHIQRQVLPRQTLADSPAYAFQEDVHSGMYSRTCNALGFATNATPRGEFDDQGLDVQGNLRVRDAVLAKQGSVSSPAYAFKTDETSGIYYIHTPEEGSHGAVAICTQGAYRGAFDASGLDVHGNVHIDHQVLMEAGTSNAPSYAFSDASNTGLYLERENRLAFVSAGQRGGWFDTLGLQVKGFTRGDDQFLANNGRASKPMYAFNTDQRTGMYYVDPDALAFSTEGSHRVSICNDGIHVRGHVRVGDQILGQRYGSASNPVFSFDQDPTSGMYLPAEHELAFATQNTHRGGFCNEGFFVRGTVHPWGQVLPMTPGNSDAPAYSFSHDPHTGMYNTDPHVLAFATHHFYRGAFDEEGLHVAGRLRPDDQILARTDSNGVARPSYSFRAHSNTGMYLEDETLALSVNGTKRCTIDDDGLEIQGALRTLERILAQPGTASSPAFTFAGSRSNTGMYIDPRDDLAFSVSGTPIASANTQRLRVHGEISAEDAIRAFDGCNATPSFSFASDPTTGMHFDEANLSLTVRSSDKATLDDHGLVVLGRLETRDAVRNTDGTAETPAYTFATDHSTGIYRASNGDLSFTRDSTHTGAFTADGLTSAGNLVADRCVYGSNGSSFAPTFSFRERSNTGMYLYDDGERIGFTVDRNTRAVLGHEGLHIWGDLRLDAPLLGAQGSRDRPQYSFQDSSNSGLYLLQQRDVAISAQGHTTARFGQDEVQFHDTIHSDKQVRGTRGTPEEPSFAFSARSNTGLFLSCNDDLGFSRYGVQRAFIDANGLEVQGNVRAQEPMQSARGSVAAPAFAFREQTDTGMYLSPQSNLSFAQDGSERGRFDAQGLRVFGNTTSEVFDVRDQVLTTRGSAYRPSYSFSETGNSNTGMFLNAEDEIAFSHKNHRVLNMNTTRTRIEGDLDARQDVYVQGHILGDASPGNPHHPVYSFCNASNTGMYLHDDDDQRELAFSVDARHVMSVAPQSVHVFEKLHAHDQIQAIEGSEETPSYAFQRNSNTGLMLYQDHDLAFLHDNIVMGSFNADGLQVNGSITSKDPVLLSDGDETLPAVAFESRPHTGMFLSETSNIAFSTQGHHLLSLQESVGVHAHTDVLSDHQFLGDSARGSNAPAYSFRGKTRTGTYLNDQDDMVFSHDGTSIGEITGTGMKVHGIVETRDQVLAPSGAPFSPSHSFSSNASTGMFMTSNHGDLAFARNGTHIASFGEDGMHVHARDIHGKALRVQDIEVDDVRFIRGSNDAMVGRFNDAGLAIHADLEVDTQILAARGSSQNPSLSFQDQRDTGMYLRSNADVVLSYAGTDKVSLNTAGIRVRGTSEAEDQVRGTPHGTSNSPAYSFIDNTRTGMYLDETTADLVFACEGQNKMRLHAEGARIAGVLEATEHVLAPSFSFSTNSNTNLHIDEQGHIIVSHSNRTKADIDADGVHVRGVLSARDQMLGESGRSSAPAFSFTAMSNTGMYWREENQDIGFAHAGRDVFTIHRDGVRTRGDISAEGGQMKGRDGDAAQPTFSFESDSNTGMFIHDREDLAFARRGQVAALFNSNGLHVRNGIEADDQIRATHAGDAARPAYSFEGYDNTGTFLDADRHLAFSQMGKQLGAFDSDGLYIRGSISASNQVLGAHGTERSPAFTFREQSNIGMYLHDSNDIAFARDNARIAQFDDEGFELLTGKVRAHDQFRSFSGNSNAPSYSFHDRTSTGMFLLHSNDLAFVRDGELMAFFDDTGVELFGSLSIGNGNRIIAGNGTQIAPTYTFEGNNATGIYLDSNMTDLALTRNGSQAAVLDGPGWHVYGNTRVDDQILGKDGNSNSPSFSFQSNRDTGIFLDNQNDITLVRNQNVRGVFDDRGVRFAGGVLAEAPIQSFPGSTRNPTFSFSSNASTGMYLHDNAHLSFSQDGTLRARFVQDEYTVMSDVRSLDRFLASGGEVTRPSFSFASNADTGMYLSEDDHLALTQNGALTLHLDQTGVSVDGDLRTTDQIKGIDGTATNPAFSFVNETSTGMFLKDGRDIAITRAGTLKSVIDEDGLDVWGTTRVREQVLAMDGVARQPAYSFRSNVDTGMFLEGNNGVSFSIDGDRQFSVDTVGVEVFGDARVNSQLRCADGDKRSPAISFQSKTDTGIFLRNTDEIAVARNANLDAVFDATGFKVWGKIRANDEVLSTDGNTYRPGYAFNRQNNTGMYLNSNNALAFSSNNTFKAQLDRDGWYVDGDIRATDQIIGIDGQVDTPAFTFKSERKTGLYLANDTDIAFSQNNAQRALFHDNGLDVNGEIEASDQILGKDGTSGDPAFAFTSKTDTGMYLNNDDNLALSYNGNSKFYIDAAGVNVRGTLESHDKITSHDGSTLHPAYSFNSNTDTGMYLRNGNDIAFSRNNTYKAMFDGAGLDVDGDIRTRDQITSKDGSTQSPAFSFTSNKNTGIYLSGDNDVCVSRNNTKIACFNDTGIDVAGKTTVDNGSAQDPTYTFARDSSTGMYINNSSELMLTQGGSDKAKIASSEIEVYDDLSVDGQIIAKAGSTSSPSLAFANSTSTGVYKDANNDIAFTRDNADKAKVTSSGLTVHGSYSGNNGSTSDPTYSFNNNTNSGMYTDNNGDVNFSRNDTLRGAFTTNGMRIEGTLTTSGDVLAESDRRLKHDIRDLENATEKICALQGVRYKRDQNDRADRIGFIAQDVASVLPEVVQENEKTGMLSVNYGVLTALLVEGFKELAQGSSRKTTLTDKSVQTV